MAEEGVSARWIDNSKGHWIAAGDTLQVVVPDCKAGRFLSVSFNVAGGRDCDFDIMFEPADDSKGAITAVHTANLPTP